MSNTPDSPKKRTTAKPASETSKPRGRAAKPVGNDGAETLGAAGDDADLQTRIARRAYEISQSESAGDAADNWLRAEREVRGA
jgi:hypothetical protein